MAAQIDLDKCGMCGGFSEPLCVEICPDELIEKETNEHRILLRRTVSIERPTSNIE